MSATRGFYATDNNAAIDELQLSPEVHGVQRSDVLYTAKSDAGEHWVRIFELLPCEGGKCEICKRRGLTNLDQRNPLQALYVVTSVSKTNAQELTDAHGRKYHVNAEGKPDARHVYCNSCINAKFLNDELVPLVIE